MNEQHVQGRLNYRYSGKEVGQGGVRYCDLIIPSDTGHPHTTLASMIPQPDARRLSACWNACETYSTEQIESWRKVAMDTKGEPIVALVIGVGKDQARRLASCWKACDGLTQDHFNGGRTALGLSKHAKAMEDQLAAARTRVKSLEKQLQEQDAQLGKRPCQNQRCVDMSAARALLAEFIEASDDQPSGFYVPSGNLTERIRAFLKGDM